MELKDFHGFPESVKAFEKNGVILPLKGGDGIMRMKSLIPQHFSLTIFISS